MPRYRDTIRIEHKGVTILYDEDAGLFRGAGFAKPSLKAIKAAIDNKLREKFEPITCFADCDGLIRQGEITSIDVHGNTRFRYIDENDRTQNKELRSYNSCTYANTAKNADIASQLEILKIARRDIDTEIRVLEKKLAPMDVKAVQAERSKSLQEKENAESEK